MGPRPAGHTDFVSARTHIYLRMLPILDASLPCCTQHLNINKKFLLLPHFFEEDSNSNTSCPLFTGLPFTSKHPSCLVKATHTRRQQPREISLLMEQAVLSAVPQTQMKIGLRFPTLLSAGEFKIALLNVTTVSAFSLLLGILSN